MTANQAPAVCHYCGKEPKKIGVSYYECISNPQECFVSDTMTELALDEWNRIMSFLATRDEALLREGFEAGCHHGHHLGKMEIPLEKGIEADFDYFIAERNQGNGE